MPLVNNGNKVQSFYVDHTKMIAPAVRIGKKMKTKSGDKITVFDLRFCLPNVDQMGVKGMHSLEHLFAGYLRKHLETKKVKIIDVSGMMCRTGFYCSVIGNPSEEKVAEAWEKSMNDILKTVEIPEANVYQCGYYKDHDLTKAKGIAYQVLLDGIGIMKTKDILLSDEDIKSIADTGLTISDTPDTPDL